MQGQSPLDADVIPASKAGSNRMSDLAYSRVLQILFERRLPAGAYVSQKELVEMTGVPIAPLRDALRVLEAEGILTIHPRSGIEFIKPGLELTRATYQFRGIIESSAVAAYAEVADDGEMAEVERRHLLAVAGIEANGLTPAMVDTLDVLEQLLHIGIVSSLQNPLIENSYRRLHNYVRLVRLDRKLTAPLALRSLREHLAIIKACRNRSAADAVAALQVHFANALQRSMGLY
jgi:DNA-binding GntR family transcriptional regulator